MFNLFAVDPTLLESVSQFVDDQSGNLVSALLLLFSMGIGFCLYQLAARCIDGKRIDYPDGKHQDDWNH